MSIPCKYNSESLLLVYEAHTAVAYLAWFLRPMSEGVRDWEWPTYAAIGLYLLLLIKLSFDKVLRLECGH